MENKKLNKGLTDKEKVIRADSVSLCVPVVANNYESALEDLRSAMACGPDFIEFRRDSFTETELEEPLNRFLASIRDSGIGIIYTYRSPLEGGAGEASEEERSRVYKKAIEDGACDYIDIERSSSQAFAQALADYAHQNGTKVILSTHNFEEVPERLEECLLPITEADVIKGAFMLKGEEDLGKLIVRGQAFRRQNRDIPLILIGMGSEGRLTRIFPEMVCSNLTFVTDSKSSAPGQISIGEVRKMREKAFG